MKVKTIREFKDLKCDEKIREIGEEFIVEEKRAKILSQKGFVQIIEDIEVESEESKEDTEVEESKEETTINNFKVKRNAKN